MMAPWMLYYASHSPRRAQYCSLLGFEVPYSCQQSYGKLPLAARLNRFVGNMMSALSSTR